MHARAEHGVAAHWDYKEDSPGGDLAWLNRIVEWQQETSDPSEFMSNLKFDLDQDEVFVFTPKGKVIELPVGATPIDFAYTIHTDVGHRCVGAKVNGRSYRSTPDSSRVIRSRSSPPTSRVLVRAATG